MMRVLNFIAEAIGWVLIAAYGAAFVALAAVYATDAINRLWETRQLERMWRMKSPESKGARV